MSTEAKANRAESYGKRLEGNLIMYSCTGGVFVVIENIDEENNTSSRRGTGGSNSDEPERSTCLDSFKGALRITSDAHFM